MFRKSDDEMGSVALNLGWALRAEPPGRIVHVRGPAFSCARVDYASLTR